MDDTGKISLGTKRSFHLHRTLVCLLFLIITILLMLPLYAIFLASFKPGNELIRYGLNLKLNFSVMSFKNYRELFLGQNSYFLWFRNSFFLTIVQTAATLLVSACVGYGFAMYRFKYKNFLFTCVLLIMMVPFEILMLPMYQQTIAMHLTNKYAGIILPFVANASAIFFFRQFLSGIPKEIMDAGRVDGVSEYGIFARLIFPLMKPAFAAMAILTGMNSWNNFLWPLLVLRESSKLTLPIGLNTLLTPYGNNYDLLIAGSCFSIFPILVLFLCFQKYFIEGLTAGSVKG
jgi:ABC-type sugar transport system, permease component